MLRGGGSTASESPWFDAGGALPAGPMRRGFDPRVRSRDYLPRGIWAYCRLGSVPFRGPPG